MLERVRRAAFRACVLPILGVLLAGSAGCGKNDMARQVSIRDGETIAAPRPDGVVPRVGVEPELFDDAVINAMVNPIAVDPTSVDAGRVLFADHCSPCHGRDGNGEGALTAELGELDPLSGRVGPDATDGYLYSIIRQGGISMPAYGPDLAVRERWELVNFIRTFAQD